MGDAVYHTAELNSQREYVIYGNIGEADYIGFQLYGLNPLNSWNWASANINAHNMAIDPNGDIADIKLNFENFDQYLLKFFRLR